MNGKDDKFVHSAEGKRMVGRSTKDIVFGIVGCLIGGLLLVRAILMLPTIFDAGNSSGIGFSLGGVTALGIISIVILRWG